MIDKLEMFIALAHERHFGRAAEAVGVTQPTLSSAVKQLEDQLGVQLVHRGSRFQGLTPEGQRVYDRALRIIADTRALRDEMRAVRSGLTGDLRIGVIPTALPMVADLTAPFTERHPNVRVMILSRTSSEILGQIDALELDAGITYLDPAPARRHAQLPLYRESYCLLVAAHDKMALRDRVSWAEVGQMSLCLLTRDMQNRRIVDHHLARVGAAVSPMVESNSMIALVGHVLTGRWVSVVSSIMAAAFAGMGGLVAIPIVPGKGEAGESQTVGIVAAQREPHTPVLAALLAQAQALGRSARYHATMGGGDRPDQ
ncbi:MAG: LysR family transcriptional regulator [Gemmobacter sp.]